MINFAGILGVALAMTLTVSSLASDSVITDAEWSAYRTAYVSSAGRVIDTGNGDISHSEGQGYGLLLSYLADDRASFELIWSFTKTELMVRADGLAAWRWEADKTPHISDTNNATDGDILIAYALALAGEKWEQPEKLQAATSMVEVIGKTLLLPIDDLLLMLPGAAGFSAADRKDGPVINPSYWVFEAFPVFAKLTPDIDWTRVGADGLTMLRKTRIYPAMLPPDWVSLAGSTPAPAADFPPDFGYNNIRIPVYLLRANAEDRDLAPYRKIGNDQGIARVQVTTDSVLERLGEPGYKLIQAVLDCRDGGAKVPTELSTFAATSYYAATLQLLLLDHLRRNLPQCLAEAS